MNAPVSAWPSSGLPGLTLMPKDTFIAGLRLRPCCDAAAILPPGQWPIRHGASRSFVDLRVGEDVMGDQAGHLAVTLGGAVHAPAARLQDTRGAPDVFLSRAAEERGLHVRRDPALDGAT